jgi:maltose alpha-D-glucosyltransferase / alpha-amylase
LETRSERRPDEMRVILLTLAFSEGDPVTQVLPLFIGGADEGEPKRVPAMVARFSDGRVLWDALYVASCRQRVWDVLACRDSWQSDRVRLFGVRSELVEQTQPAKTRLLGGEQSNSTLSFDEAFLLKFLRKFEPGPHPDADIIRALGRRNFAHVPRYAGEIRCATGSEEGVLALLTTFVPNQGECWTYALGAVGRFFERALSATPPASIAQVRDLAGSEFPARMRQLGQRTGEMHRCLESIEGPDFEPEPFTMPHQLSLYETMQALFTRTEGELTNKLSALAPDIRQQAIAWSARAPEIRGIYSVLREGPIVATKTRVHGDYHLGQVLNTGSDFVILDFEGEPRKTLSERLLKRSPLVDVAGMLRSFDYALEATLLERETDREKLLPWALEWLELISASFLEGYKSAAAGASFLPPTAGQFEKLLTVFLLDKAVYEIGYELNYRPDFLPIPLSAVNRMVGGRTSDEPSKPGMA